MIQTLLIAIFTFTTIAGFGKCGNKNNNFCQAKYLELYDGDTIYVQIPKLHTLFGERLGVRVKGVDTPELRDKDPEVKKKAYEAKAFTQKAMEGAKRIDLLNCVKGKYFRIVCDVFYDGKSLRDELISNNLGKVYPE